MKRIEIVRKITQVVLEKLSKEGELVTIERMKQKPMGAKFGNISVLYSTPFLRLPGCENEYILDIWEMTAGKVMSVRWEKDIENMIITSYKRGEWIKEFLPDFKV